MTLRTAEEVATDIAGYVQYRRGAVFEGKPSYTLSEGGIALIHADRLAVARRVIEGLAAEHRMHETLARNVGLEDEAK
jgi:hypothetical protein